jgi:predicted nuclease of restriction endonuclease-like RecB superfamily
LIESWDDSEWQLTEKPGVLDLGETALVPDLIFQHAQGAKVYLEMLGYWTPRYLQDRLLALERSKLTNYLYVAVEELRCSREAPAALPANVIVCKTVLKAKDVAQRLARLTYQSTTDPSSAS